MINIEDVQADTTSALAEQNEGLAKAPTNLGLDDNLFTKGDLSGYTTGSNNSKVNNLAMLMNEYGGVTAPLRAIRMTYNTSQVGAIWSNVDAGNYMDIKKKQTLSMWLYFGPSAHKDGSTNFGDGMAFVMQNSDMGIKAFSHKGTTIGAGETLGVWGIDNDYSVTDPSTIASTAIDHSWALEFDTNVNNTSTPGAAASYDKGISGQHIAYGYPGDSATYSRQGSAPFTFMGTLLSGGYYYTQNHTNTRQTTLTDGNWHHLTISWNPTTYKVTYSFNDKNVDGSKGTNPITVTSEDLKAIQFGDISSGKLRWGFTATTGSNYQANLVAFESIPASVEGDATATIYNKTQAQDVNAGDSVNSNDNLAINYNLTYNSGRDDWSNIVADLNLPTNVTYLADNDGNIGMVTYKDGTVENIPASDLSGTTLSHKLTNSLNNTQSTANISINGVADSVAADTSVASQRSNIDSDNLIKDIYTPAFTIKKSKPINLSLDQNNISVQPNKDAAITGTVSYTDGSVVNNTNISVHATLNGTALDNFTLNNTDASGKLNFTIPAAKLTETSNDLEVYVQDSYGNKSTVSKVIITKTGSLSLTVNNDYEFSDANQVPLSHLISRKGDWDITVNDGRDVDDKNVWTLSASTTGLYNGSTPFNGNMIYRDDNGLESSLTGTTGVNIADGMKTESGEQTTDVTKSWNDAKGIFLKSNGLTTSGRYEGKIDWTLSDTI